MTKALWPLLGLLALAGCRTPQQDYGATRQRSEAAQQELNAQPASTEAK
jgi:uncharacterized lipoprotein YajG